MSLPLNFNRLFTKVPFNELPLLEGVKLLDEKITIQLTLLVNIGRTSDNAIKFQ